MSNPEKHYCRVCGSELTDENWRKSCKAARNYICKTCQKKWQREYYTRNYYNNWYYRHRDEVLQDRKDDRKTWLKRNRDWKIRKRKKLIERLGSKCFFCGSKTRLHFHRKSGKGEHDRSVCFIAQHITEFVLICSRHHRAVHAIMDFFKMTWEEIVAQWQRVVGCKKLVAKDIHNSS